MQLNKLSAVTGLLLTALLSACGGGGDEEAPAPAAPAPVALAVSNITLSSSTPTAIAETALQFDGGVCSGGSGTLTTSWDFGDGTTPSLSSTHTYAEAKSGQNKVTVTCTDTTGAKKERTLDLAIASVAMNGFMGKTWSAYSRIDPTNLSTYPVAGISNSGSGDFSGVWIRRDNAGNMEVAAGTSNFTSTTWAVSGTLDTSSERSPFNDTVSGGATAVVDQAVSLNGHVMAAWKTGTGLNTAIWYTNKSSLNGTWSTPISISVPVTDESIKVVVNDAGDGAIAYCESSGAYAIPYLYLNNTLGTPQKISNKCDVTDTLITSALLQRSRAFDIAIDNSSSKIYAAGIVTATLNPTTTTKSAVALQTYSGGTWTSTLFADEIATSPTSLSFSLSPNSNYAAIVWNQVSPLTPFKSNVFASVYAGAAWGATIPVQYDFITKDYTRPLVAINDKGVAFLAMRLPDTYGVKKMEVSNYDAAASTPAWRSPLRPRDFATGLTDFAFQAVDIAIDEWGTGLVTTVDSYNTFAGTFSKTGIWSGFKAISPRYPFGSGGSTFHYQSMRALPNGRAIVVTSVYDDQTPITATTQPIPSGYILLK